MDSVNFTQKIDLSFSYPVRFVEGVFSSDSSVLQDLFSELDADSASRRALVFVDAGLAAAQPELRSRIESFWKQPGLPMLCASPVVVPGGEAIKNDYRNLMAIIDQALESRLCRHSFIVAIGGGAVLDAVGFAASILHRGVRMIRMPSTVLAQNDAGVGVKTGMNLHGGKNTIGTFAPPAAVVNDASLLTSLSLRDWRSGIPEAVKVAMIREGAFFDWLADHAETLGGKDAACMQEMIQRCARLHLEHIAQGGDPFELGRARPLDFGHWAAHKLESLSDYQITHGEAVGLGLLIDSLYAVKKGWLAEGAFQRLYSLLSVCGLPLWVKELALKDGEGELLVLQGLEEFREHLGGELCVTFPDGLGSRREESSVEIGLMSHCIETLERYQKDSAHVLLNG